MMKNNDAKKYEIDPYEEDDDEMGNEQGGWYCWDCGGYFGPEADRPDGGACSDCTESILRSY